jgi:copper chaperone CopZ
VASTRHKGLARKTGINLLPILIYVLAAVIVTAGMYVWDLQFRKGEDAKRRPPDPEVVAKNLVENVVGAGVVKEVKIDREKKTIAITFESALFKPDKPKKELRELLDAEATLAAGALLDQMRDYGQVTLTLTNLGKTLAVAEAARSKEKPSLTYVDERLKE